MLSDAGLGYGRMAMRLSSVLRKLMKQRDLTTKQLAEDVCIPEGTLKTWLAGSAPRSLTDVRRVAQFLNVSFEFLIFGEESSPTRPNEKANSYEVLLRLKVEPIVGGQSEAIVKGVSVEELASEKV
jgi:transcriptional regulator with XRE-family HTH domain